MLLATKLAWVRWLPLAIAGLFAVLFAGERFGLYDMEEDTLPAAVAVALGVTLVLSLLIWVGTAMVLVCPKCGTRVGSRFDVPICRQCGHRL